MGFWSTLGKIAGVAAPIVAAPFTGGASLLGELGTGAKIANGVSAGLGSLGAVEAGREAGRDKTNVIQSDQDKMRLTARAQDENALENRAGVDLSQRQFAQSSQTDAYKKALLSSLMKNIQDVKISGLPQGIKPVEFSGGLRPSALGGEGKAAADALYQQAMMKLMNGESFDKMAPMQNFTPTAAKQGSLLDTILGTAGAVGKGVDQFNNANAQDANTSSWQQILARLKNQQVPTEAPGTDTLLGG